MGIICFFIGVYGNRFYKKLITIVFVFLAIMSVAGVGHSTHLINHVLAAYNMEEYVERNDLALCYVGVKRTILLLICFIGYGLMAMQYFIKNRDYIYDNIRKIIRQIKRSFCNGY